jgi:hypothetical protein
MASLETRPSNDGFQAWHFFVLASLIAATVAVVVTKQTTPESLVLTSLAIGAGGAAAFGIYRVLLPLTSDRIHAPSEAIGERQRSAVEREKRLVLRSIKELEFDRAMGKVSVRDFDEMSARLRSRAIALMRHLDADGSPYRAIIERELSARLSQGSAARTDAASARTPACACGTVNDADARFCKSCGTQLAGAAQRSS